ncbi:hypothetical protein Tcan_00250 [Toxocara canis]|uniref:Uncharacterized protein n=1 Tax=Toxocara canis TaxID=6265 RepID=A0A0B2VM53_TOXCA|nr:hypothetical protein Tcan_00250 [Toxocara canis]
MQRLPSPYNSQTSSNKLSFVFLKRVLIHDCCQFDAILVVRQQCCSSFLSNGCYHAGQRKLFLLGGEIILSKFLITLSSFFAPKISSDKIYEISQPPQLVPPASDNPNQR